MKKLFILFSVLLPVCLSAAPQVKLVGNGEEIWASLLSARGVQYDVVESVDQALTGLGRGDGLIITAPLYPSSGASVSPGQWKLLKKKGVRVFVEFPSVLPGGAVPSIYQAEWERGVVTDASLGLPEMSVLGMGGCHIMKTEARKPLMVLAKVAGFDTAVFGLEDTESWPLLYREGKTLVATTSFSRCLVARYGPTASWERVIAYVMDYVCGDGKQVPVSLAADPAPMYPSHVAVNEGMRKASVKKAADWLWNARLFIHPSWERAMFKKYQPEGGDPNRFFGEPITDAFLQGDGCRGIMEGHASEIDENGTQKYRYFIRADVHGESAFLLGAAYSSTGVEKYARTAEKLLDYLFYTSGFRGDRRNNPQSPSYGLLSWANSHPGAFFNDDHARCILGSIGASAMLGDDRWNSFIVENILSNFRLSSADGFIGSCLFEQDIVEKGWEWYADRKDFTNPSPHFESWMWALYLWLYQRSGYTPLLDKARTGITYMMERYPDWIVQNGIQQERARMILPLAWLVRVEDTPQHRQWLDTVVSKFLECQDACGAIREELGDARSDHNHLLITSNAEYGKNEASLIAQNGDPVADMLYTCNFGFFALNEAACATGNEKYREAVRKLADFLVRIQVSSQRHPDLDGAWFRAFDFGRWDYWASNADNGWGAWCTLCGWIETWIGVTEYLVSDASSYWSLTSSMDMTQAVEESLWMLER